jgi:hypothetical protein
MSFGTVKLRATDRLFTKIVRIEFDYTCQRCGKIYDPYGSLRNLGVSHYWGRGAENTRFLMANVTLLCNMPCHTGRDGWQDDRKGEYKAYMIERLGQEGYDILERASNTYKKRNDVADMEMLKEWYKKLIEEIG